MNLTPRHAASCRETSVFPTPVGPVNKKGPHRTPRCLQSGPGSLDRRHQGGDGGILAENHLFQPLIKGFQIGFIGCRNTARRNFCHLCDDLFDIRRIDFFSMGSSRKPKIRTGFIDHINRLVRQITIVQEFCRQFACGFQRCIRIPDPVMRLIP